MNTDDTAFPLRCATLRERGFRPSELNHDVRHFDDVAGVLGPWRETNTVNVVHPFIREKGFDCEGNINNYAKCRMEVGVNAEGTISSGTDVDYWSVILPDADRDGSQRLQC